MQDFMVFCIQNMPQGLVAVCTPRHSIPAASQILTFRNCQANKPNKMGL